MKLYNLYFHSDMERLPIMGHAMTKHEQFARSKGLTLIKIEGRMEWWQTADGKPKLYDRDAKRWSDGYCVPR